MIPTGHHDNNLSSSDVHILNQFGIRLLLVALAMMAGIGPAPGQAPGIIDSSDRDAELYHRANRYYNYAQDSRDLEDKQRAYRMSIPLFREYLSAGPRGDLVQQASYKLGMALLLSGEREAAEQAFTSVINRYRNGQWVAIAAYRLAAQLYNRKEWAAAVPYFSIAGKEATDRELAHKSIFYESRCLQMAGQSEQAIKRLKDIVEDKANPYRDYARLAIGELYARQENHEEALIHFEALLIPSVAPQERARALLSAGVSAAKLNQQPKARDFLNRTLDSSGMEPKHKARAQLALMEMSFAREDHAEAIKTFRSGEYLGERHVLARIYLVAGQAFAKLDRHKEAIAQFFNSERLAVSIKPKPLRKLGFEASFRRLGSFYQIGGANIPAQVDIFAASYGEENLGSPWLHKALLMKAETLFHEAAVAQAAAAYNEVNPSALPVEMRADIYFKRGWCLADTGEYGRAAQNLSSFLATFPDHPRVNDALAKRGHAYLKIGDRKSALKDFKRLLERKPEDNLASFAYQYSGRIHRDEQRWPEMISSYEKLLSIPDGLDNKARADARYWMGWGYYKQEEWALAIPHFEASRELLPQRYREPAGVHIVLAAYSLLDSDKLKKGVENLLADAPHQQFPSRMLIWLGLERFSKGDYEGSDRFLSLASTPDEPEQTDTLVWRHLAKARVETRKFEEAADALTILLTREQEDFWKADSYLDQSHVLVGLQKWEEAHDSAQEGLSLKPYGTVQAGLHMTLADIDMHRMNYESAAANYLKASRMFIDDREIKPLGLFRAADALEKNGQPGEAAKIRKQLRQEFPGWDSAKN
ncbi:MAG: hypothetical protein CMO35_02300 [Verrucomicrobiaceae bacterium]|nr:hypothetical protein [Verrucomicrobiaceae bacterium]